MKLALGTAQFGSQYGIANTTGIVSESDAGDILRYAKQAGFDTIDTAMAYGKSQQYIGNAGISGWKITTKLPEVTGVSVDIEEWVRESLNDSLSALGVKNLAGLILHRPIQLLEPDKADLWPILVDLKNSGVVEKIGYSIYSTNELDLLWDRFKPDLVQAPYNIFDQSLVHTGWMEQLSSCGVEIHVRSIFLQGLLLMPFNSIPEEFKRWSKILAAWDEWITKIGVTRLQAATSFALADSRISRVIVGVDSLRQLKEIVSVVPARELYYPEHLCCVDEDLINPSRWNIR